MHRSGHHAVIDWIRLHSRLPTVHYNDLNHPTTEFPSRFEHPGRSDLLNTLGLSRTILSYEDVSLDFLGQCEEARNDLGLSHGLVVLILRDAYNMFASRLVKARGVSRYDYDHWVGPAAIALWKQQARQYLEAEAESSRNVVVVNFNRWVSSAAYRRHLAGLLRVRLAHSDPPDAVSPFGGGSSFDKFDYADRASEMRVNSRWQRFARDREYRSLFDAELRALCGEIFSIEIR